MQRVRTRVSRNVGSGLDTSSPLSASSTSCHGQIKVCTLGGGSAGGLEDREYDVLLACVSLLGRGGGGGADDGGGGGGRGSTDGVGDAYEVATERASESERERERERAAATAHTALALATRHLVLFGHTHVLEAQLPWAGICAAARVCCGGGGAS